jgi:hypothetical protein
MQRLILLGSAIACTCLLPLEARSDGTASSASATPPPQIYHVVTTPLCQRLRERIRPAIAMILQNDSAIAKSPPLFKDYQRGTLSAIGSAYPNGNGSPAGNDSINNQSPETSMALQRMSYLVLPVARNLISAQTTLDDTKLVEPTGNHADDQRLQAIKAQLLQTVAFQSASLDLINGFVQTQQMGELQHAGEEYLSSIQGTDSTAKIIKNTPNPWQDPNTPGLAPNPYAFDVTAIPGLAVGYNPLRNVEDGLQWLRVETQKREDAAGKSIADAWSGCGK